MNEDEQPDLLYHSSLRASTKRRGCLFLCLLPAAGVVAALLYFLDVVMPQKAESRGEASVYYRNDELVHFQMRQRTPLPLNIPAYVDPASREEAAVVENDGRIHPQPLQAPAFDYLFVAPDSVVLGDEDLLALPPEGGQPAVPAGPAAPGQDQDGGEVQP